MQCCHTAYGKADEGAGIFAPMGCHTAYGKAVGDCYGFSVNIGRGDRILYGIQFNRALPLLRLSLTKTLSHERIMI